MTNKPTPQKIRDRYAIAEAAKERMALNTAKAMAAEYGVADTTIKDAALGRHRPKSLTQYDIERIKQRRKQHAEDAKLYRANCKGKLAVDFRISPLTIDCYLRQKSKRDVSPVHNFMTMKLSSNPAPSGYYNVFGGCH